MLDVLAATIPIFLIVGIGYVVTRVGILKRDDMAVLSTYVVRIALPALVFINVVGHTLRDVLNPTWLLTYAIAAMVMLWLGRAFVRSRRGTRVQGITVGFAMSGTNNGFVGLPIFLLLLPDVAGLAAGMAMIVDNTFLLPIVMALYETAAGHGRSTRQRVLDAVRAVATHPLAIAIALALLLGVLDLDLHPILDRSVTIVANSSSALALFAIGGMLAGLRIGAQLANILASVGGKLLLMPVLSVGLVVVLPMLGLPVLSPDLRAAVILTCALPSMTLVGVFGEQHGEGELGAATMMLSTVVSFVTLSAWMMGLQAFGWL